MSEGCPSAYSVTSCANSTPICSIWAHFCLSEAQINGLFPIFIWFLKINISSIIPYGQLSHLVDGIIYEFFSIANMIQELSIKISQHLTNYRTRSRFVERVWHNIILFGGNYFKHPCTAFSLHLRITWWHEHHSLLCTVWGILIVI